MPEPTAAETVSRSAVPAAAIILAAGKSTRMKSRLPKPLHPLCGLPMTAHVIRACQKAGIERVVVVVGHEAEKVKAGLGDGVAYALQEVPRGTGDAVKSAQNLLGDWTGTIIVLAGDVPLLPPEALSRLLQHHTGTGAAATLLTAELPDPTGYGRVVRTAQGHVARIVEEKDATPEERALTEWNPSLYAFDAPKLWQALESVRPANAQGEFYLTDTIGILAERGERIEAVPVGDARYVQGVNNRVELAAVGTLLRERILHRLMLGGVSIPDPASTYIETDVRIGQDTTIEPNTHLLGTTEIGEDGVIGPNTRIENSTLGNNVRVLMSQIAGSVLENGVKVGPFAHLRPGTHLGENVKIGDFVEVKNATMGRGAQASHLSYIGDAAIGAGTNIGAGVITCNYDGVKKYRTVVGENAFIGSNSTLIAPVTIGDGAFIAAASPIPADVPPDALAIARERPVIKPEWAAQRRAALGIAPRVPAPETGDAASGADVSFSSPDAEKGKENDAKQST